MQSYSSPYTGAFGVNPGDKVWDQNLSSLGGLLFPDQSKVAQAYHFGSAARQAQLESNKLIDQQNYRNRYGMMTQGGQQPGPLTFQQPGNVPGAAPIADAPANLPYTGAASAAPAAPISNLVAMAADKTPQQGADLAETVISQFTTGRAAQMYGSPEPGLPPSPQTYGTDGSTPNDEGILHPGSITSADGGRKQSGPAAHNGSPAPMPPGMTLPGLMAMSAAGSLGGLDAASVQQGGAALAYEMYSRGIIGRDQYHQMLGATGSPTLATTDVTAAATVKGHQITAAAELAKQNIVTGEGRRQFEATTKPTIDPATGEVIYTPQRELAGKRYYEPTVAAERTRLQEAPGQYIDPKTGQPTTMTGATAIRQGTPAVPTSVDQQNAILDAAIQRASKAGNPEEVQRLLNVKLRLAVLPKGPVEAKEADAQAQVNYRNDQAHYPQPDPTTAVDLYVKAPVMFKPEAERAITERMKVLRTSDRWLALNTTDLRAEARQQLEDEDVLYKPEEINMLRRQNIRDPLGRDPRIQRVQPVGTTAPSDHMMIGLKPKADAAGAPTVSGAAPPGALGPAPAGSAEGAPVYSQGSRRIIGFNRGGWVMPTK